MTACRACKSSRMYLFLALGNHPLANGFVTEHALNQPEPRFPLDVHVCLDCGLIQVADNIPAEFFRQYVYIPSASEVMKEHFAAFADTLAAGPAASHDALVVDIGCNDGLLLKGLKDQGVRTLGVDPATNIVEMAREKGLDVVNEYFTPALARQIRSEHGPAAVVVTTNTFHHIGDLDTFTEGVTLLLDDDGVFVVEVPYALDIVEAGQFDGIYHEHVSQFTMKAFVDLFARFGMEVLDVQLLDVHAGSLRVFAGKATGTGRGPSTTVGEWVDREAQRGLFSAATYDAFRARVERNRDALLELLGSLKRAGERIVGYGASARGNTLLNYYGIGPEMLDYIVDRNALKHGLYTPGMNIPVYGVERLLEDMPPYVLVIAWNFAEEIVRQQAPYAARGGKFLLPIPEVRVLESAGV